jgi:hypothetical protein
MRQGHQYVIAQKFMRHPIKSRNPNWQLGNPSNQDSTRNFEPLRQMTPRQSGVIASRRFAAFT